MKESPSKSLTLYDIAAEGQFITDCLIDAEGELTPEIEERLNALMTSGPGKILAAGHVLQNLENAQAACKMEAQRLNNRAKMYEEGIDKLKERMVSALDLAFGSKLKLDRATYWTQKAKDTVSFELAKQKSEDGTTFIELDEDKALEQLRTERPDFVRVKLELNKQEIQAAYDREEPLPDAIFANKKTGGRYLRWK